MARTNKKQQKADVKRISGAGGLRDLVSELEDALTPAIVDEISGSGRLSQVLTGDYHIDTPSQKMTIVTFYAKTKDKAPREQSVKGFLEIVEENILEVGHKDFDIETEWGKDSKFTTGVLNIFIRKNDVRQHQIKYGIKPSSSAKASLYSVLAQECLQVVGCAYLQAKGSIDETEFTNFLHYAEDVERKKPTSKEHDTQWKNILRSVDEHTDYGPKANRQKADIYTFGLGDKDWIQSTVTIAKKLESLYKTGEYYFCHADSTHVNWMWTAYKDAREQVLKNKDVFAGITAQHLDRNKWNPADMFAMQGGWLKYNFRELKNSAKKETNAINENEIRQNIKKIGNTKTGKIDIGKVIAKNAKKAATVEGFPSLNLFLLNEAKAGKFYPISLKKVGTSARLDWINDTAVDVSWEATLTSVEWKNEWRGQATNKVEVHFKIFVDNEMKDYYINARQFNEGSDIKLQIEKTGAMAFHGKIGLKMSELIINKTDPGMKNRVIAIRNRMRYKNPKFVASKTLFSSVTDIKSTYSNTTNLLNKTSRVLVDYVGMLSQGGVTKIPNTETGNISKVQATEFGYIINKGEERGFTSYILYSLFTYAGSRGLVLFDGNDFKNHFASSVHIKVM